jgi:mannose-6-phosphate isomerase-like protein (cupin superfamily)
MLSFLAKHPARTRVAHLSKMTYDDGRSTVNFKPPSDRYLVVNQLPPDAGTNTRSSVLAPPLHWHAQQDETFHVLQGAAQFELDGQSSVAGEGHTVHIPRGCFHRFRNASGEQPLVIEFVLEPAMRERDEAYFRKRVL